ncbi:hypothetical protein Tco_0918345 [Tanacetum coccineum]
MKTEAMSLTMSRRMTASIRRTSSTKLCSSSRALRTFTEQSHNEVRGCLKGGSGKGGRKLVFLGSHVALYLYAYLVPLLVLVFVCFPRFMNDVYGIEVGVGSVYISPPSYPASAGLGMLLLFAVVKVLRAAISPKNDDFSQNHNLLPIRRMPFPSNFPNYLPSASPDYIPTSQGKTYSSSSNSFGIVPLASPTLLLFYDDLYMKVLQAFYTKKSPIPPPMIIPPSLIPKPQEFFLPKEFLSPKKQGRSSSSTSSLPQAFEIGESSRKTSIERHGTNQRNYELLRRTLLLYRIVQIEV